MQMLTSLKLGWNTVEYASYDDRDYRHQCKCTTCSHENLHPSDQFKKDVAMGLTSLTET